MHRLKNEPFGVMAKSSLFRLNQLHTLLSKLLENTALIDA